MEIINKNNFSEIQFKKIIEFKKNLESNNESVSKNYIVSQTCYYKDKTGNFYCSYCLNGWGNGEYNIKNAYIKINNIGEIENFDEAFPADRSAIDKFTDFEKIEL